MKKLLILVFALCVFLCPAVAENAVNAPDGEIRPGKACIITFTLDQKATVSISIRDDEDRVLSTVLSSYEAEKGSNSVWWNGTSGGKDAPEGNWRLVMTYGKKQAETPITIGKPVPYFSSVRAAEGTVRPGEKVELTVICSEAGTVSIRMKNSDGELMSTPVEAGENTISWQPETLEDGSFTLILKLTDDTGDTSGEEHLTLKAEGFSATDAVSAEDESVSVPEDDSAEETMTEEKTGTENETQSVQPAASRDAGQAVYNPSYTSPFYGQDQSANFWTTPMDITDEEAVWKALTAEITVVDIGSKSSEKVQTYLRAQPDEESEKVGVVTCETQGVHVLETLDNGWSLVECYSSSFHDTKVQAWNCLVQGYIKTAYLKTVTPNQNMGFVIDKLTQRLYIFVDGHLYDTLLVSTGLSNAKQPYNETRSGEFITASKVGQFVSDKTYAAMAIRINSGDLIHEVLHVKLKDGGKDYSAAEAKLGQRASHGCIRVQRRTTPNGVNMTWIWNHIKGSSKVRVFIWEDWQGRQIAYPDDDTPIYYNEKKGTYYHSADHCNSAKGRTFTQATYADLSGSLSKLKPCPFCTPVMKREEIDQINAEHVLGGDHDPILTKARVKYYTMLSGLDDYLDGYYQNTEGSEP